MSVLVLHSASEALPLDYLSYGFAATVNSVWAWVALITAAYSFWRIRAIPLPESELLWPSHDPATETSPLQDPEHALALEEPPRNPLLDRQGSTKMKFTATYYDESNENVTEEDAEEEEFSGLNLDSRDRICCDWEKLAAMRMKMGELDWYRWQDRSVLNGSVVRLWHTSGRCL